MPAATILPSCLTTALGKLFIGDWTGNSTFATLADSYDVRMELISTKVQRPNVCRENWQFFILGSGITVVGITVVVVVVC